MIGIRADANSIIASGHVMRCLTIAREIRSLEGEVTFFVADEESRALLTAFNDDPGIWVVVLGTDWRDMESELPALKQELGKRNIDTLLVDSYQVTERYFQELSGVCRLVYMDDLGKEPYPVDLIINYSGYYEQIGYEKLYKGVTAGSGESVEMLLGLMYAPLRRQFWDVACSPSEEDILENPQERPLKILLTAGGADMHGMLPATLERADEEGLTGRRGEGRALEWHVVIGNMVRSAGMIEDFAGTHEGIHVHRNVTDMASLMRSCDIAVAAAGTMLTECAALRLPAIFYQVADNQKFNVAFWQKTGGMVFAGDVSDGTDVSKSRTIGAVLDHIRECVLDPKLPANMGEKLIGITDGRGAERIARKLLDPSLNI